MTTTTAECSDPATRRALRHVSWASSLGALFEFYDFYLYGSLAAVIARQFFSGLNDTSAFIAAHGRLDVLRRLPADLCQHRRRGAGRARGAAHGAGTGVGRRVRRGGHAAFAAQQAAFARALGDALRAAGYPREADPRAINRVAVLALLTLLIVYVSVVYGPLAAWLVEMFPPRIRYSAISLPYHIGFGWFGGFLPAIAFAIVARSGDIYGGLGIPSSRLWRALRWACSWFRKRSEGENSVERRGWRTGMAARRDAHNVFPGPASKIRGPA